MIHPDVILAMPFQCILSIVAINNIEFAMQLRSNL